MHVLLCELNLRDVHTYMYFTQLLILVLKLHYGKYTVHATELLQK